MNDATWRRFFRPRLTPIHADGRAGGGTAQTPLQPTIYVLSRALCSFSRVRLSGKNEKARAAAKLGVAFRQGYADPQTRLIRDPEDQLQAGIWSWDGEFEFDNGVVAKNVRVLPETLARAPHDEGARLVKCNDGFEGQVWRNSALIASRWWSSPPMAREWQHFLRAAQIPVEHNATDTPTPVNTPFRSDLPYIDLEPASLRLTFAPTRVAATAATIFVTIAAFQTAQILTHSAAATVNTAKIRSAFDENRSGIEARQRALTALGEIEKLDTVNITNPVALAFLTLARELPSGQTRISNFRVADGQVEARITTTNASSVDIPDLVSRLEKNIILRDVFAELRNNTSISVTALIDLDAVASEETPPLRE